MDPRKPLAALPTSLESPLAESNTSTIMTDLRIRVPMFDRSQVNSASVHWPISPPRTWTSSTSVPMVPVAVTMSRR